MSTLTVAAEALLAVVRLDADFTEANTSLADFRAWDAEGTEWGAVIVQRAPSAYGRNLSGGAGAHGVREQRHALAVLLARKRGQDADGVATAALWGKMDALVGVLDTYPRLDGAVLRAEVVEVSEPRVRQPTTAWMYQIVAVDVWTRTTPVLQETAGA